MHRSYGLQHLRHKRLTFASADKSGHTLGSRRKIAHNDSHGETGAFRTGPLLLPSERSTRFGNPAWPGFKTANFAAFGPWLGVLQKDAESLRNSDALMRVAVPRRRGPAGLRSSIANVMTHSAILSTPLCCKPFRSMVRLVRKFKVGKGGSHCEWI